MKKIFSDFFKFLKDKLFKLFKFNNKQSLVNDNVAVELKEVGRPVVIDLERIRRAERHIDEFIETIENEFEENDSVPKQEKYTREMFGL